ncbi:RNA-binding domain-containing protein [Arcticibacter eurypsychrophilus]|uniref:RNA-binding domain-containing protein n=1 Tax=Arcticibacter eurypsychrophilus TaxID=1434752 RepID=UPI00084DC747|nr:RNA-binding domain-containing protein [Arcticibacter eurypsychrophilus]
MEALELLDIIQRGESSKVQFKERLPHTDSLAHELIAFSNSDGGKIIIGVNDKTGELNGVSFDEIQAANQKLVNAASQSVFPAIIISSEVINVSDHNLMIVTVSEGLSKPYKDRLGTIYVKNGSDKRRVTSNDEIARLLQSSKNMFADEIPVNGTTSADVNLNYFNSFINRRYGRSLDELGISLPKALENLSLLKEGSLTLAGVLLFSENRHIIKPLFSIQCVAVDDVNLNGNTFKDNEPAFEGKIDEVYLKAFGFINRNIKKIQTGTSFNSLIAWEIPQEVFEETLVNSLIHRDYFVQSTIKVFMFSDRIEIVSPGKLPNSLTIENISNGISIARNPVLQSLAQYILPYKGLGTGIGRAIAAYPEISFINDVDSEQFKVIIPRPVNR